MLPSARPLTRSWTSNLRNGNDLAALPDDHDVVALGERVVLLARERPLVALDESGVLRLQLFERIAHPGTLGRLRLLDRQRHQVEGIVGVGGADGRRHVLGARDAVLVPERLQDGLAARVLTTDERVGL